MHGDYQVMAQHLLMFWWKRKETVAMINIEYFNEMDRKISQAGVRELLEIRKEVLSEAAKIEESVLEAADEGVICWVEDEAFVYRKQMEWVAKCCERLATLYDEREEKCLQAGDMG